MTVRAAEEIAPFDAVLPPQPSWLREVEVVVVLGGDGTILRAVELVRGTDVPVVGINLGHMGFLAESDVAEITDLVDQIARRDYTVERRMTIDVRAYTPDGRVHETWAMNEATVGKNRPERMIELAIGVDGRALETFGCDGVVLATPTGSTAYAFSAGGPVVWPDVDAMLLVPLSAHALFARPLVVGPASVLEVELLTRTATPATMWCDGRRTLDLPPGSRVEARRGAVPVAIARLSPGPFSERLVRRFDLPVAGWRGRGQQ
ncbi:NAD kinase 2 [Litorihabitans aurantiacus]|uniref:NAD kinase n=2 Tax=Litorihabitans aurantiacus TaxID=1930061 RepID=A0AA37XEW6_9MICO|nr:NAD kinase 2 [Litorihabitans aurantiacus]